MTSSAATAAVTAQIFVALALGTAPTASSVPLRPYGFRTEVGRKGASMSTEYASTLFRVAFPSAEIATEPVATFLLQETIRETTPVEHAVGELRRWIELPENWDGEGAAQPIPSSLREATAFARLLPGARPVEPMLHANGRAGLYLRTGALYADIEFLGDGRMAYYIESNGDKHKGVVSFDSKKMPPVFDALLEA